MSGLFGGGKSSTTYADKLVGISLQTSAYGGEIRIIYGTDRVPGNLIWHDDFTIIQHSSSQDTGKGGGSTQTNVTYTYTASVILAIAEGPVASFGRVWRDKDKGTVTTFGLTTFTGARGQAAWSYLTSNHPTKALGYSGTALVCHPAIDLGESATLKNHSFEVVGFQGDWEDPLVTGAFDANPAEIIPDLLTNAFYGGDLESAKIADLLTGASSYGTYCQALGMFLSLSVDSQKAALDHLKVILQATNSEAVWSQGTGGMTLKIVPYGDEAVTGNGTTYTPVLTIRAALTDDDYLVSGSDDPITIERIRPSDAFNSIPVKFKDRSLDYDENTLVDPIQDDIDTFGLRQGGVVNLDCIKRPILATLISRLLAQKTVYSRNKFVFDLGWKHILLEPMDYVTIASASLGLATRRVRIESVEETDDGNLTVTAWDWPVGMGSATTYTTQAGSGTTPDTTVAPGNANTPVAFDVPVGYQTGTSQEVIIGTSGGDDWGGCEVWVSYDDTTYNFAGTIDRKCRHGELTATLAVGSAHDVTNTLAVDLTVSGGTLDSVTSDAAEDLLSLCFVEGATSACELVAYQTATLTAANKYDLTILERGAHATAIASHASARKFMRLDEGPLRLSVPASRVGQLLYYKLVSFNTYGDGLQDISTLTPYTYTAAALVAPTGYDVTGFTGAHTGFAIELQWDAVVAGDLEEYEIREGGTGWADATLTTITTATSVTLPDRAAAAYTFRIKAKTTGGIYSTNAASVVVTVGTISIPSSPLLTALASLAATGIIAYTSTGTPAFAARTITGTADRIGVSNGDGVSGNPTLDIAATYVGQTSITTLGTVTTGTWSGTAIGLAKGGTNADLSATGGTSYVLQQSSAGAAITVAQLAASNLSNGVTGSGAVVLATAPTVSALTVSALTSGRVTFAGASGLLTDYAGFTYTGGTTTGGLAIPNTTASTSTITGALVVSGGAGIAGAVTAGGLLTVTVNTAASAQISGFYNNTSTSSANAYARFDVGEASGAGSKFGSLYYLNNSYTPTGIYTANTTLLLAAAGSTGGLKIGCQGAHTLTFITNNSDRGSINSAGTLTFPGVANFTATTASTSITTGALIVSGGGAFMKAIFAGEKIISVGSTSGIGYGTGAGGTVAQATNKATGVTLNKVCGTITMDAASLAADTGVAFTLTNSAIAATDVLVIQHDSGGTLGAYGFGVTPAAGSAVITVHNNTPGALAEAIVLRFVLYKAVTA